MGRFDTRTAQTPIPVRLSSTTIWTPAPSSARPNQPALGCPCRWRAEMRPHPLAQTRSKVVLHRCLRDACLQKEPWTCWPRRPANERGREKISTHDHNYCHDHRSRSCMTFHLSLFLLFPSRRAHLQSCKVPTVRKYDGYPSNNPQISFHSSCADDLR